MALKILIRKVHYWVSIAVALPLIVIVGSGVLLQLKKHVAWIQPATQSGSTAEPTLCFAELLDAARTVPQAGITAWSDVERLDVRPHHGIVKIRSHDNWEVQLDTATAAVLQVAYRRSDWIESIHDGSFFHAGAKLGVFLPTAVGLVVLWVTGLYLFVLPWWSKWRRARRVA